MRFYETAGDRRATRQVLHTYCAALGWAFALQPVGTAWDADLLQRGRRIALAEVKVRHVRRQSYATYKIDCAKVDAMLAAAEARDQRAVLVVQFQDGLGRVLLSPEWLDRHAAVSTLARVDRGDPFDTDAVYEWSNALWVMVGAGHLLDGRWRF